MADIAAFRRAIEAGDHAGALDLLADHVEFRSPAVHRPYRGKTTVGALLRHAAATFDDFRYVDEIAEGNRTVLTFRARVGDRELEGIDSLTCDDTGQITELVVMIRPLSGLIAMAEAMGRRLEAEPLPG